LFRRSKHKKALTFGVTIGLLTGGLGVPWLVLELLTDWLLSQSTQ
jgi:hypothetical protein